jgi:membrane-bound lytic murein transglycosylase A
MFVLSVKRDSIALAGAALALSLALAGCTAPSPTQPPSAGPAGAYPGQADGAAAPATTPATTPAARAPAVPGAEGGAASAPVRPSAATAPDASLLPGAPAALPGWRGDNLAGLRGALALQCASRRPPAPWPALCAELPKDEAGLVGWISARFNVRPLTDDAGGTTGLITGYHEPELSGTRVRESASQVPLYRRPPDAVMAARPSRERIETSGLLAGSELVWLDDPVEAFFLQVQGSGRVRLRDGSVMRVGYGGDNGLGYRAIGSVLVARGALPAADVNAGSIKEWLRANPADAPAVMRSNPRYIFFRELPPAPPEAGPPGSLGVPLTPMRSVAVDPKRVPPGALLWLDTTDPLDGSTLQRLVVAQDTGAAIVGTVRADLFWGAGERAARGAGLMKQPGRMWLLEPRP